MQFSLPRRSVFCFLTVCGLCLSACASDELPPAPKAIAAKPAQRVSQEEPPLPPAEFQFDKTLVIEFMHPDRVVARCAERGATVFVEPGIAGGACADGERISAPNPCYFSGMDFYARLLCHELGHANGWPPHHPETNGGVKGAIAPARLSPEAQGD